MTLEERAREIAEFSGKCNFADPANCPQCIHQITEALRTVRDEALEEAAKVADDLLIGEPGPLHSYAAAAIRSLKSELSRERETG